MALLSDMNQPLGAAIGNALEVREAIDTLRGSGPADFWTHCLTISGAMLRLARPLLRDSRGALLAMKVAEGRDIDALVLISPAIPAPLRPVPPPHVVRLVPAVYQAELIDWAGSHEQVQRQNQDLTIADVRRVQHLMGAESGAARRQSAGDNGQHSDDHQPEQRISESRACSGG